MQTYSVTVNGRTCYDGSDLTVAQLCFAENRAALACKADTVIVLSINGRAHDTYSVIQH